MLIKIHVFWDITLCWWAAVSHTSGVLYSFKTRLIYCRHSKTSQTVWIFIKLLYMTISANSRLYTAVLHTLHRWNLRCLPRIHALIVESLPHTKRNPWKKSSSNREMKGINSDIIYILIFTHISTGGNRSHSTKNVVEGWHSQFHKTDVFSYLKVSKVLCWLSLST